MSSEHVNPISAGFASATDGTAPLPVQADGLWLDDLVEQQTFRSDTYAVTPEEIAEFARRYDPQPFHLDEVQARGTFFDGLAASGWLTAAITMRLLVASLPIATGIIGSDISLKWPSATRAGDILHLEIRINTIARSSSRPGRGSVGLGFETVNQHGDVRQQVTARLIAWQRPRSAGSS